MLKTQILSLNVGEPQVLTWQEKSVTTSMLKMPVPGPLVVKSDGIEGDRFSNSQAHGTIDSVVYALGMSSALEYVKLLGRSEYPPGALGENLTLQEFDETQVSVGDIFQIGEVRVQATFPRIPCAKVNVRMEHPEGQTKLVECGRSGVYFRVLKLGLIHKHDEVERIERARVTFSIYEVYRLQTTKQPWPETAIERALANGAFPVNFRIPGAMSAVRP